MKQVASLLECGVLKAHVSKTFAFENMAAAFAGRNTKTVIQKMANALYPGGELLFTAWV